MWKLVRWSGFVGCVVFLAAVWHGFNGLRYIPFFVSQVSGTVATSQVVQIEKTRRGGFVSVPTWQFGVQYVVDGKTEIVNRFDLETQQVFDEATLYAANFPVGASVAVSYLHSNPKDAWITLSPPFGRLFGSLVTILVMTFIILSAPSPLTTWVAKAKERLSKSDVGSARSSRVSRERFGSAADSVFGETTGTRWINCYPSGLRVWALVPTVLGTAMLFVSPSNHDLMFFVGLIFIVLGLFSIACKQTRLEMNGDARLQIRYTLIGFAVRFRELQLIEISKIAIEKVNGIRVINLQSLIAVNRDDQKNVLMQRINVDGAAHPELIFFYELLLPKILHETH